MAIYDDELIKYDNSYKEDLKTQYKWEIKRLEKEIKNNQLSTAVWALAAVSSLALLYDTANLPSNYDASVIEDVTRCVSPVIFPFSTFKSYGSLNKVFLNFRKKTQAETMVDLLETGLLDPSIIRNAEQERGKVKTLKK